MLTADARDPHRTPRRVLHGRGARRAAHDGPRDIVLPPEIKAIAPGTRLAGPVWTVVRPHRSHEDAARNAARLVHAARRGARGPRRRLPAQQSRGRADGRALGADAAGARRAGIRRRRRLARHRSRARAGLSGVLLVPHAVRHRRAMDPGSLRRADHDRQRDDLDRRLPARRPRRRRDHSARGSGGSRHATEEVVATESDMRRALVGGMDPVEAYNKYGKF